MDDQQRARDLKPCPFCGGEATHIVWGDPDYHWAGCEACDLGMDYFRNENDALEAWNRRAARRAAPEVIRIPAGDGLDPITLYVDDAGNGSGHLTITCYADAWTCYWGSMGCGLTEFVARVDAGYLLSSMLWPNLGSTGKKTQAYVKRIAQRVINQLAARPQGVKDE